MKEIKPLYLITILGLITLVSIEITINFYSLTSTVGQLLLILIITLFLTGIWGIFSPGKLAKKLDMRLFSRSSSSWNNLGKAYFEERNFKDAIYCYKKVLEINPDDVDALQKIKDIEEME